LARPPKQGDASGEERASRSRGPGFSVGRPMKVKGRGRRFSVTSGVGVGVAGSVIGRSGGLVLVSRCSGLLFAGISGSLGRDRLAGVVVSG
jgi:hypothetical protein